MSSAPQLPMLNSLAAEPPLNQTMNQPHLPQVDGMALENMALGIPPEPMAGVP